MKKSLLTLLAICVSPLLSLAQTPATAARPDIEEMLSVMRVEKTMQAAMAQVKRLVPQMTANMAAQAKLPPEAAAQSSAMQEKLFALIEEEMSWKNIKPEIVHIYAESLTPDEVKGITTFYKSPAGQAFLDKQPTIMEKTMAWQQKMGSSKKLVRNYTPESRREDSWRLYSLRVKNSWSR